MAVITACAVNIKPTSAAHAYSSGLAYSYNNDNLTATVTGIGTCTDQNVVIPATVTNNGKTYRVTALGSNCFRLGLENCTLTLPEGLEIIEQYAFYQARITELALPSTLKTIAAQAFAGANIVKLTIPAGVQLLSGTYIMHGMHQLESVRFLGETTLEECNNLFNHSFKLTEVYLPNTLTTFFDHMFGTTGIKTLVIGDKVTSIPYSTFTPAEASGKLGKVENIYYNGTPAQKATIAMSNGDDGTVNPAAVANWYYYSQDYRAADDNGNEYWYYDDNGDVALWRDHPHVYGEWATTTEPTCTAEGVREHVCEICGEAAEEAIPMVEHVYNDWMTATAPTCTEDGVSQRACVNCGGTETQPIPATGHNYSDWEPTTEATCTADGIRERICQNCDHSESESVAK
ncbi:MAG: leucine-rich repeat domain-containing protein, partial [Prevotella sp.]|nr:leucine-rich repeat domain-containing protein [Prevotella sp.]